MAARRLLHLLLINNVFGARAQLLCVIRAPQPLKTVGAPRDLAAASSLCPKIKQLGSLNPNPIHSPLSTVCCLGGVQNARSRSSPPSRDGAGLGVGFTVGQIGLSVSTDCFL